MTRPLQTKQSPSINEDSRKATAGVEKVLRRCHDKATLASLGELLCPETELAVLAVSRILFVPQKGQRLGLPPERVHPPPRVPVGPRVHQALQALPLLGALLGCALKEALPVYVLLVLPPSVEATRCRGRPLPLAASRRRRWSRRCPETGIRIIIVAHAPSHIVLPTCSTTCAGPRQFI